ncbi:OTU domain-containing protein [Wolbachia endosymbiont (group B) of Erebia ligea]|uniref:hypothetical protein n=1 Tax=Wolbachia endosymbiont (group B) of Erebia ligea TaxID=2954010 RepID=UPI0021F82D8F|nr:hypothetical protein [Wolbachia endosymbiont (group B) of Erebia ligea]
MHNLKSAYPEKLKIGAAIKTGDCFFDSVAQGLNELNIKPDHYFTAKSLIMLEQTKSQISGFITR